jgi:integrase
LDFFWQNNNIFSCFIYIEGNQMSLTETKIKNALAKEKPYKMYDIEGLYLLVNPNGRKYWRMKYRFLKKEKTLSFGAYPLFSLWEARNKCFEAKKLLEQKIDPCEQKKRDKLKVQLKYENTFEVVVKQWIEVRCSHWAGREAKKVFRAIERDLFKLIGQRPIADIKTSELFRALKDIEKINQSKAYRTFKRCRQIFRYAIACGLAEDDITKHLIGMFKKAKTKPRRFINNDELPLFLQKLAKYDNIQVRLALELLMLTFVRSSELCGAAWDEFDLVSKEWHIPAARMKMRRKHIVPLSNQALAIIEQLSQINGHLKYVFPDPNKFTHPISRTALLNAMSDIMEYCDKATPHSIRSTASTILNENHFNAEHIEIQLSHTTGSRMHNNKYIYAYYLPDRHKMMQWWADYLDNQKNSAACD